jgi:hypothetical protein
VIALLALLLAVVTPADAAMPRYTHIFVIVEENKDYARIVGSADAPVITHLAKTYGSASRFYAETHPSEPNYVAMVGGYTYGIRDDDAFYCKPHDSRPYCSHSDQPGYVNHTIDAPSLATQLDAAGLSWKNYEESLPQAGSLAVVAGYYASKHSGFVNFAGIQHDPQLAQHLVGFDALDADLRSGDLPAFSLIVPNVCNEMHGARGAGTPADCRTDLPAALIARGDREIATLTHAIMTSPAWSQGNAAIVITFDEDDGGGTQGCCGNDPSDPANAGGGHIPTVVITNHGPRGAVDRTPYNHYSLLRTIEDAFGIHDYLMRAAAPGVVPMVDLFKS